MTRRDHISNAYKKKHQIKPADSFEIVLLIVQISNKEQRKEKKEGHRPINLLISLKIIIFRVNLTVTYNALSTNMPQ